MRFDLELQSRMIKRAELLAIADALEAPTDD
jgi:hypothetical protein